MKSDQVVATALHGLGTFPDFAVQGLFSPQDDAVRAAMERAGVRLVRLLGSRETSIWRAYLGFNLSHSLGLFFFGLVNVLIARRHAGFLREARWWLPLCLAVSLSYLALAATCWFYVPTLVASWGTICFLLATLRSVSLNEN